MTATQRSPQYLQTTKRRRRRGGWVSYLGTVLVFMALILWGLSITMRGMRNVHQADEIKARGVTTAATIVNVHHAGVFDSQSASDDNQNNASSVPQCKSIGVSYVTANGRAENRSVHDSGDCPLVGSTVQVVYDPSAVNVVKLASERGNIGSSWDTVGKGGILMAYGLLCLITAPFHWLRRKVRTADTTSRP